MNKFLNTLLPLFFVFFAMRSGAQGDLTVSIISGESETNSSARWLTENIQLEIQALLNTRHEIVFRPQYCDYNINCIREAVTEAFSSNDIRIVIASDPLASIVLAQQNAFPKPALATIILDSELQELPQTPEGTSGIHNFSYVESPFDIDRDIRRLHGIFPFRRLGLIGSAKMAALLPVVDELTGRITKDLGAGFTRLPDMTLEDIEGEIPDSIDAIYILPLFQDLDQGKIAQFFNKMNEKKIGVV